MLLLNRDYDDNFADYEGGLSIKDISDILDYSVETIRKVISELARFYDASYYDESKVKQKWSLRLCYQLPDYELKTGDMEELHEILTSYREKRSRVFSSGRFDNVKFYMTFDDGFVGESSIVDIPSDAAYLMLSANDYNALRNFLKDKYISDDILHMDENDFYNVIPMYTTSTEGNITVEREIAEAIIYKNDIDIEYGRSGEIKTIKPLRIVRYSLYGVSYVVTVENGKLAPYRIDRIQKLCVNEKSNIKIDDLTPLATLPYIWGMDSSSGDAEVTLKVYNHNNGKVVDKVRRDIAYYQQKADYRIEELNTGDIIVSGYVIGKNAFLNWVRTYGASMVILEPKEWGQEIITSAKRKLRKYGIEM